MSSNTNIGNTPVNQGYVQLIHTGETGGIDGTLRTLYDGDGTASDLQIASNKVKVSTELYIGSKTATEFIQDIVGDMFTTGSYTNITTTYDDTNGNIDLSASGEVTLTGTQTLTNKTLASPTFTGTANGANLTLTGDLTVSGDTIFTNSNNVLIGDAILTLNADETGSPTANAGFEVERGTSTNKSFLWNETDDKWTIGSETFVAGTVEANLTGNVTGSASLNLLKSNNLSDLTNAATARSNLGVDAAGTDNSTDVTLAGSLDYLTLSGQQITRNAIDLTTDVTGTLPASNGGTGLTSISTLLNSNVTPTSLGLVIGTDVQAQDTLLQDIADFSLSNPSQDGYLIAYSDAEPQLELVAPGISFNGSTANGLLTYGNSTTADVESNLTFDGTDLKLLGDDLEMRWGAGQDFKIYVSSDDAYLVNVREDKDIRFMVNDGNGTSGANITALKIDASDAGTALFSHDIKMVDSAQLLLGDGLDFRLQHDGSNNYINSTTSDQDLYIRVNDGGSMITALQIDASEVGKVKLPNDLQYLEFGAGGDGILYSYQDDFWIQNVTQDQDIRFRVNDGGVHTDVMTMQGTTARVGIGVTDPSTKLEVAGHTRISGVGNALYFDTTGSESSNYIKTINDYETLIANGRGSAGFGVIGNQSIRFGFGNNFTNAETDLFINTSGNVGIGNTSPDATLHIGDDSSSFTLGTTSGDSIDLLKLETDSTNANQLIFSSERIADGSTWTTTRERIYRRVDSSNMGYIQFGSSFAASTADMISFGEVGVGDYMGITGDGKVGIGTNSPSEKLHVNGSIKADTSLLIGSNSNFLTTQLKVGDGTRDIRLNADHSSNAVVGTVGSHDFNLMTANTFRMTIDSSGSVGIGTQSPGAALEIKDYFQIEASSNYMGILGFNRNVNNGAILNGSYGAYQLQNYQGKLYLEVYNSSGTTINSSALVVDNSANIGIGTSSPSSYKLQFGNAGDKIGVDLSSGGTTRTAEIEFYNGADGSLRLKTDNASTGGIEFHTEGSQRMEVLRGGNVHINNSLSIGTTNTGWDGDADNLVVGSGSGNNGMTIYAGSTNFSQINFADSNSGAGRYTGVLRYTHSNNSMSFHTNDGAERMRIDSSGNVLIGGTSASGHGFNLEVLNDHAYVKGPDGWNGTGDKAIVALGSAVSNESFGCGYVYGTGLVLSTYKLSGGGDFGSSTQNSLVIADTTGQASFINDVVAFASSDKRLKENVKPLDNALDKIKKINGVEFDWIDGKDEHGNSVHSNEGHDVGVIAQEIEEVLPEVVHTRDNGYKAVKYEKIVPLLIEAIKEQQQQIEELKNG